VQLVVKRYSAGGTGSAGGTAGSQQPHGGDRSKVSNNDDARNLAKPKVPRGETVDYALRRLRKDRPDIHARVLAGECAVMPV
jgi:hypothetical protein